MSARSGGDEHGRPEIRALGGGQGEVGGDPVKVETTVKTRGGGPPPAAGNEDGMGRSMGGRGLGMAGDGAGGPRSLVMAACYAGGQGNLARRDGKGGGGVLRMMGVCEGKLGVSSRGGGGVLGRSEGGGVGNCGRAGVGEEVGDSSIGHGTLSGTKGEGGRHVVGMEGVDGRFVQGVCNTRSKLHKAEGGEKETGWIEVGRGGKPVKVQRSVGHGEQVEGASGMREQSMGPILGQKREVQGGLLGVAMNKGRSVTRDTVLGRGRQEQLCKVGLGVGTRDASLRGTPSSSLTSQDQVFVNDSNVISWANICAGGASPAKDLRPSYIEDD